MLHFNKPKLMTCLMAVLLLMAVVSCKEGNKYTFQSVQEAIDACESRLLELRGVKTADIKDITEIINDWSVLQDSTYNMLVNDTADCGDILSDRYFVLSDSIRDEIARVTLSTSRSLRDVLYLKLHTAYMRSEIRGSRAFKETCRFFEGLDTASCYQNLDTTISYYNELLQKNPFSNEEEFLKFIADEDRCFRSLLCYLEFVDQKDLQRITNKTARIFESLTKNVSDDDNDDQIERIRTYLQMRFNRRIIQNAMACMDDIKEKKELTDIQVNNYRWMIIQPFFSIDNYAMSLITVQQEKAMYELAEELPELLARLDGINIGGNSDEDVQQLTQILVEYFIKSWLKLTI